MLSGEIENDGLQYHCKLGVSEILSCDFTQVSISSVKDASDWPGERRKIIEEFEGMSDDQLSKQAESICEYSKQLEDILAGRVELPTNGIGGPRKSEFKALIKKLAPLATDFCSEPSVEHMLAMTEITFDRETRTCQVTINNFSQHFKESASGWSVVSEPDGQCGIVQLSKFEQEDDGIFWRYTARKAITNPQNETAFGFACDKLDETAYPYSWESVEKAVDCDFIRY
ncbi:hypothetical protein QQF73_00585 [Marinobacter sp. M216]|uniref:Ig-like domain-containing protein n=1 Tax=Marinobacter albus TaxID=3030833 RepID=A0ABT7H879_9GAMM|nr:hypothetical protein [Marinobacter sp. M216]MDK9556100.1 hypothetical protein [Marinobacter sp. M216]